MLEEVNQRAVVAGAVGKWESRGVRDFHFSIARCSALADLESGRHVRAPLRPAS